ncbi:MAG TPA: hypothetical protein VFQ05_02450 [Candidatus Eisenbacteria bacterium]|nr:hypothetical protein [Candidatus Eisenbacteria bacterium]
MRWRHAAPLILVLASLITLFTARRGAGVPLFGAQTGLACGSCHFDPNGGGPRNEFGFNFAKNRHRVEPEEGKPWSDVALVNRVGDSFPLYIGLDHRLMLLSNDTDAISGNDRAGFYNMENAIHLAFQPFSMLTMVYTRDGFDSGSKSQDAFGMISGGPWGSYLKAGRFRTPFGLRMDDHTVATRNGYLDFLTPPGLVPRFLPYDPRTPDMGIELGGEKGSLFARASYTNGETHPFNPPPVAPSRAQAKTAKLGFVSPSFQAAASFYDDFRDKAGFVSPVRATRWGAYAMGRVGPVSALLEIDAGTDEYVGDTKNNLHAGFAELDWTPARWINVRARYDRMNLGVGDGALFAEDLVYERYAFETEWVPVPFAELRATVRQISQQDGPYDETQGYLQFHFSY